MKKISISLMFIALIAFGLARCNSSNGFGFAGSGVSQPIDVASAPDGSVSVTDSAGSTPILNGTDSAGSVVDTADSTTSTDSGSGSEPIVGDSPTDNPPPPPSVVDNTPTEDDHDGDGIVDENESDDDNDGIADTEDNLSDVCTVMRVTSTGTSAARITLNDEDIFTPSDFHNKDFSEDRNVNLQTGSNTLEMLLAGSPGDHLKVQIYNCSVEPSVLLYEKELVRVAGKPQSSSDGF